MTEEQIWDIIDGTALPEVQKEHEQLLKTDAEYRAHFDSYTVLHDQLCHLDLDAPSMRFEQNLMERLQPSVKTQRSKDRLPLFFLAFMSVLGAIVMALIPNSNAPTTQNDFPLLESINTEGVAALFSNPILFYGFILINAVLLFLILDKKVFKPYFDKKNETVDNG